MTEEEMEEKIAELELLVNHLLWYYVRTTGKVDLAWFLRETGSERGPIETALARYESFSKARSTRPASDLPGHSVVMGSTVVR